MSNHMTKEIVPPPSGYIPSARSTPPGRRRNFSEADKRRIVEEACRPGASPTVMGILLLGHRRRSGRHTTLPCQHHRALGEAIYKVSAIWRTEHSNTEDLGPHTVDHSRRRGGNAAQAARNTVEMRALGAKLRTEYLRVLLAVLVLMMSAKVLLDLTVPPMDIYSIGFTIIG